MKLKVLSHVRFFVLVSIILLNSNYAYSSHEEYLNSKKYLLNDASDSNFFETKLVGAKSAGPAQQGDSVALSADGTTLAIGAPGDDENTGAVWIFTRSGSMWIQQGPKLVGTGSVLGASQGDSIALSADGNTLAIGGPDNNDKMGAVWVFTRSGSTWNQQGSMIVTKPIFGTRQGNSVALSADGNTLAIGGPGDGSDVGAVWILTRSGSTWRQQGQALVGSNSSEDASQGESVALSADGNTLAVGGPLDYVATGAVWIFTRSGSTWSQQGQKLVGSGNIQVAMQGGSIALSADGNTLAIGGPMDNDKTGTVWIFTRSGSTWKQQGTKLVGTGSTGAAWQGSELNLSADGYTLAFGGPFDNNAVGAVWIFTRSGSVWNQQGSKLVATNSTGPAMQGTGVALTVNGTILAVGGPGDDDNTGAAWIFD